MSEEKILDYIDEAPHLDINQDASSIDLSNWHEPANRNWSYRHITDVFPFTQKVSRGDGPAHEFNSRPVDISSISVTYRNRQMDLQEYLYESHCDGFLVLQGNDIIYENYLRMQPGERHLCQSVSKTTVCAVISELVMDGVIDVTKTVDEYIPDVSSGFAGVKIQDLLDMNVALKFDEDFTNPDADIYEYEMISGWHPDTGGQKEGIASYINKIEFDTDFELEGITHYLCPNTDMLGCIIEKVTGKHFTDLFQEKIYQHIGAEADAYFSTDARGMAICSGGLIIRLRDLARYAQLYANKGIGNNGLQVIPEQWLTDCQNTTRGTAYYLGEGFQYHNQMTSNGSALCHLGICGQMLYANTETKVVVVQFSTLTSPSSGDLDVGNALYNIAEAIDRHLSGD